VLDALSASSHHTANTRTGFYKRHELQMRVGLFFSAAALSGAFSGLLAAAIVQMDGQRGMRGWQWIFLLEGVVTICYGAVLATILPNTPRDVKTLSAAQVDICIKRLEADGPAKESNGFSAKAFQSTFLSPHVWILCLALFCNGTSLFGLANFAPSIVRSMGYEGTKLQLFTVPPFAIAFFATMISAYAADRYRARGVTAICTSLLAVAGFALFLWSKSVAAHYTALCLMITGIYSTSPSLISWMPNNTAAGTRRATAVALAFVSSNSGGILSTWIYPESAAPGYKFAAKLNLVFTCVTIGLAATEVMLLRWKNQRKQRDEYREHTLRDLRQLSLEEQYDILGDGHPEFRYTL
jgi:predicted MFS family arabinose efflux permease